MIGERTFGEGSVQKTIELPDGGALLLTVAKFEGPDGKKIQDEAVAPTVAVGQAQEEDIDDENPQPSKGDEPLNKALELLKDWERGDAFVPLDMHPFPFSASAAGPYIRQTCATQGKGLGVE